MIEAQKNWESQWDVDLEHAAVTHQCGFSVNLMMLPMSDAQIEAAELAENSAVGKCWAPDGREWGVLVTEQNMTATVDQLKKTLSLSEVQTRLAQLAREAGEVWILKQKNRH